MYDCLRGGGGGAVPEWSEGLLLREKKMKTKRPLIFNLAKKRVEELLVT